MKTGIPENRLYGGISPQNQARDTGLKQLERGNRPASLSRDKTAENNQGCGNERPQRKTFCQLFKGHKGSHQAVIYWETENNPENFDDGLTQVAPKRQFKAEKNNQSPFDTTDLSIFKQAIKELDEWDYKNKVADTYLRTDHDKRIANKVLELERQRLKAEVEKILDDYEENWGAVIQPIKKRLFGK